MPVDPEVVVGAADRLRGYQREMLGSLVARRSVRGEPSDIHELCAEQLDRLGMEVELVTPRVGDLERHPEWCPPVPDVADPEALVSVVASGGEGPGILLFAHIDTEPADPRDGWGTDPYRATEIGGRIHGVGAADDKAGVVSVLAAARALIPHLEGVRLVVGLVHGKLGGGLGTLPAMERVGDVEAAVYCHPAETGLGMAQFKIAIPRVLQRPYRDRGPAAAAGGDTHTPNSEDPREGINALGSPAGSARRGGQVGGPGGRAVFREPPLGGREPDHPPGTCRGGGRRLVPPRRLHRGLRAPGRRG